MTRAIRPGWVAGGLLLVAALGIDSVLLAQGARLRNRLAVQTDGQSDEVVDGVFLPPDRTAKRRLEMAKELLDEKRYGESTRYLGSLLEGSEDYFFKPDPTQPHYRSLKAEAGRLIGEMPSEGRDSYELQFGARARRMLADAIAAHDVSGLMEVARRFFYTQAGCEATVLLARHHLDHGRPLAAALCFQRLLDTPSAAERFEPMLSLSQATSWIRAGMPERAQQTLVQLKKSYPQAEVRIGGKSAPLFVGDQQAVAWLTDKIGEQPQSRVAQSDQWTLYRGDAGRNAPSPGGVPLLSPRWRVRTASHPAVEKLVGQLRQAYLSQDIVTLPSLHPLAIGNVVLMRTTRGLLAVDFATGKRIWEAKPATDASLEQLVMASRSQQPQFGQTTPALVSGLDQRMWDDATYGTMSSDGGQVFVVEDLELGGANQPTVVMFNGQRRGGLFPRDNRVNRLAAFDLRTEGKLSWSVGGSTGEDEPKLADAFFLGPPLPLLGKLYALAEMKGQEIRLVVLSSKTGELEWSQQLAVVESNITNDVFRRSAGATPSFADGVLVCPTSAGAIVAVDLTTRSLLWGYEYPRSVQGGFDRLQMLRMNVGGGMYPGQRQANDRWVDATLTVVDGRVLATPVETDQIYCLNLLDGKLLWKQERGNNVYVACVHQGNAVIVGHRQVSAFKTSDGKAAWSKALELPAGSVPSGRGFFSGEHYYLPLTTAEVAKINLKTGTIEQRARSRHGLVPGNLICLRGEVISQNVDYLETYYQLDALKKDVNEKLQAQPDDARALARLGEIELDEGHLNKAIAHFRRSYELEADDATRDLLVDSLLEGLKADFAANRDTALELEKLIDQEQQRAKYLRLVATGLQKAGETLPAFEAFTKLADAKVEPTNADEPNLESLDESLSARRNRWVQAQLGQLRSSAKPEEMAKIDEMVRARLVAAEQAQSAAALRQFLSMFGAHPIAEEAREKLSLLLKGADSLLEKELLLGQLRKSSQPERARAATARLAALLADARQIESAALMYRELADKWAGEVCLDGKTGRQIVEELPADGPVRKLLAGEKPWPTGNVEAKDGGTRTLSTNRYQRTFGLAIRGTTAPFFDEMSITLDQQQQGIAGLDGLGAERFRVQLNEQGTRRNNVFHGFNNPMLNYTSVNHHLMLLCMGHQLLAIDTLRGKETASNRVLWTQELTEQVPGVSANQGIHPRQVNIGWGSPRYMAADAYGRPIGTMGPVNFEGICFQRFRDLVCVHPLTGEVQWTRKNAAQGSDIFGDEELLFVVPPDGSESLVLRAIDGELLGKRRVAPVEQRMATVGRRVLAWRSENGKPSVTLQDPWAEKDLWSARFEASAKGAVIGEEAVGVLEPSGQFTLLSLADGKPLVKEKLPLELHGSLLGIYLMRSRDQYLLITNVPPKRIEPNVNVQPAPGGLDNPLVNGQLFAFDRRSGKPLWPAPVAIDQQGLLLAQPSELPILALARHKHTSAQAGQHETKTSVLCIDKRTGRVVYKNDALPMVINNFELSGDRADNTVALMFTGKTITLTLTDDPVPPQPAADPAPPKKQADAGKGLFDAFGNLLKNLGEAP